MNRFRDSSNRFGMPAFLPGVSRTWPLACLACAVMAAALLPAVVHAQTPVDIPAPSDTIYELRLGDGSVLFARITELDGERVTVTTVGGTTVELEHSRILYVRPAVGVIVEGEFWHEDPSNTRLFFGATGRTLARGEYYLGTHLLYVPFAGFGLTERISISAGAPIVFGVAPALYVAPKVQVVRRPGLQAALGSFSVVQDGTTYGILYGAATFGDENAAVTTGAGYFYSGEDVASEALVLFGAETRSSRRIKLITENYFITGVNIALWSGGLRLIGDRYAVEVGVGGVLDGLEAYCCVPLLTFRYGFRR